jgi:hypothetical protein
MQEYSERAKTTLFFMYRCPDLSKDPKDVRYNTARTIWRCLFEMTMKLMNMLDNASRRIALFRPLLVPPIDNDGVLEAGDVVPDIAGPRGRILEGAIKTTNKIEAKIPGVAIEEDVPLSIARSIAKGHWEQSQSRTPSGDRSELSDVSHTASLGL